jgi:hypothetical protein
MMLAALQMLLHSSCACEAPGVYISETGAFESFVNGAGAVAKRQARSSPSPPG